VDTFAKCRGESCSHQRVTLSRIEHLHNVRELVPLFADSSCRFRDISSPISFNVTFNRRVKWIMSFHRRLIATKVLSCLVSIYGLGPLALRASGPAGGHCMVSSSTKGLGVTCLYVFQGGLGRTLARV
jgi:hypothetical protein